MICIFVITLLCMKSCENENNSLTNYFLLLLNNSTWNIQFHECGIYSISLFFQDRNFLQLHWILMKHIVTTATHPHLTKANLSYCSMFFLNYNAKNVNITTEL